nr:UvrD-helicase domain-containing protein [Rhodospirillales bacterium]
MSATTAARLREDAEARRRALTDLDATLLMEAGAGSGKTSVLAGRIAMLLAAGRAPAGIAAISFTEASASELRERVGRFVVALLDGAIPPDLAVALPDGLSAAQRAALQRAAPELDTLTCSTIHGFCRRLLAPWPIEAGLDPGASMADGDAAELLFEDALRGFLLAKLSGDAELDDPVAALFLAGEAAPEALIGDLARALRVHRGARIPDYPREDAACAALRKAVRAFRAFLTRAPFAEPETVDIVAGFEALLAEMPDGSAGRVPSLLALLRLPVPQACSTGRGAFGSYRKKGKWRAAARGAASQTQADQLHDDASTHYDTCCAAHGEVRAAAAGCLLSLLGADVAGVVEDFQRAKRSAALLDFDDLLHHARDLLTARGDVRAALGARYRHVLVDEFQDTDPLQAEILWRLCGDPPRGAPDAPWSDWRLRDGALFMVADPKQAIYRFRRAD